jgi:site-specific DNA-methyltransferase (adenine-specific)
MIKPYYENEHGKLYCGDCLEIMPQLIAEGVKVDAVVTDPPYGIAFVSNQRLVKYDGIANDKNLDWLPHFFRLACDVMRDDAHIYSFCSWHKVDVFKTAIERELTVKNIIVWAKNNAGMGDLKRQYAPKHEFIIYASKGDGKELNGTRDPDVLVFAKTGNEFHPTQKPLQMMEFFVCKSTDEQQVILDPFAGSGTTLVAAQSLGRKFIGIEISPEYCEIAKKRLEGTIRQIEGQVTLFDKGV